MLMVIAIWVLCLLSTWGLWLVITDCDGERVRARFQERVELQADLDDATKRLHYKIGLEVEGRRWTRELDRKRYRRQWLDMKHWNYISQWRKAWDGDVS